MRVGVFMDADVSSGGGFQQSLSVVKLLLSHKIDGIEYIFFASTDKNIKTLSELGAETVKIKFNSSLRDRICRLIAKCLRVVVGPRVPFIGYIDNVLEANNIDIAYFLSPSPYAMGLKKCPFIYTVWDTAQRDWPEFPEVWGNLGTDMRDFLCQTTCPRAVATLVDSETARKSLSFYYGIGLERIYTAPFFPDIEPEAELSEDVCGKYSVKKPFIFYPAQLWPHKNHAYILEALKKLKDKGIVIDAVFTGNDHGNGEFLKQRTEQLGLVEQVHWLGFVERIEIVNFYKNALALVMPTYLGHTNIPPLEAFKYGCPVCYSDLPDLHEQVGEAAFLMDLANSNSLAEILQKILSDKNLVQEKISAGYEVLKNYSPENYITVLEKIFGKFIQTLKTHKNIEN